MSHERGNRKLKWIDWWVGIPLAWVVGLIRRASSIQRSHYDGPISQAKVALLAPAAIGDTVLAAGIIQDLIDAGARVTVVTSAANAAVSPLLPAVEQHLVVPIARPHRALKMLRAERFDIIIDITPWPRINAVLCGLSGAKTIVGFRTAGQHRHWPYDVQVTHRHDVHQSENCASLLAPLGLRARARPRLQRPLLSDVPQLPARYVVMHAWPGGYRSEYKEWSAASWLKLGLRLRESRTTVVLTGGPRDRARSAELAQLLSSRGVPVIDLAGGTGLMETAALLVRALAVVSVDTGILHIAGALDVPTIGLHGPTSSLRWGAVGSHVTAIDAPGRDSGFLSLGFEYPRNPPDCMGRIDVERVWAALAGFVHEERVSAKSS